MIAVPRKIWWQKAVNKYKHVLYDDIDEDLNILKSFGKCIKYSSHWFVRPLSDLILWDKIEEQPKLLRDLHLGNDVGITLR